MAYTQNEKSTGLDILTGAQVAVGDIFPIGDISDSGRLKGVLQSQMLIALGLSASAAEINILDGATLTVTELNYVDGVTSNIQTQLDAKLASATAASTYLTQANAASTYLTIANASSTYQPLDADLTTLAGLTATTDNFIVSVASAWASRTPSQVKTTLSLNLVENTALSTWAGTSNITTLGTIGTGTWSGTTIAVSKGGTGLTALGTGLQVLRTNAGATAMEWATISAGGGDLLASNNLSDLVNFATARTNLGLAIGTNVQAYSANLTSFATVTPSANGLSFVSAANYAAMVTLLGLTIGTNTQAYNANLTTYAGIAPSANVQTLLGAANYSAFRTSLGVAIGSDVQAYNASLAAIAAGTWTGANSITTLGTVTTGTLSTGAVIGGVTMTLGSDATGDVYYRNSGGVLTRLAAGTNGHVLTLSGGLPSWAAGGGGGSSVFSDLTAATATNTIDHATYTQEWQWNSIVTGRGLLLSSSSTAQTNTSHATTNAIFAITLTGANAASNVVTKAAYISNIKTGTGAANYGLHITTSGSASQLSNPLMIEGHAGGGLIFGSGNTSAKGQIWSSGVTPTDTNYGIELLSGGGTILNSTGNIIFRFNGSGTGGLVASTTGWTITNKLTLSPSAGSGTGLAVTPSNNLGTSTFSGISFNGTHAATSAQSSYYRPVLVTYTINNTGTASTATATGIFLNATETALNSMVHNLMDLGVGGVSQLKVTNAGVLTLTGSVNTGAPSGGTAAAWKLGTVASVSPTAQNRTIEVEINGTTYYLTAKTTND